MGSRRRTVARQVAQTAQVEQSQSNDGTGYRETKVFYPLSFIHLASADSEARYLPLLAIFTLEKPFFVQKKFLAYYYRKIIG